MTASTTTTIRGVSIFSRQRKRKADVFDIALSPEGIAIQRPGRSDQHMGWDRIAQWEIEERPDCVVLTLRGGGSVTPLVVKGWTLDDLETVMRETTAGRRGPDPSDGDDARRRRSQPGRPPATSDVPEAAPQTRSPPRQVLRTRPSRRWPRQRRPLLSQRSRSGHGPPVVARPAGRVAASGRRS